MRDQLARVTKDSRSITKYIHTIRSFLDELATAGAPVSNPELIVKILSGLGPEFFEISAAIRARDTPISYEELFENLLTLNSSSATRMLRNYLVPSMLQLLLPLNSTPIIATTVDKPTTLNTGARTCVQALHHKGNPIQIQTVLFAVNYLTELATQPMFAARDLIITLKQKPTMPLGLQRRPIPG